jgi:hypothetical protein
MMDFWGKRLDQIVSGKRSKVLAFVARAWRALGDMPVVAYNEDAVAEDASAGSQARSGRFKQG